MLCSNHKHARGQELQEQEEGQTQQKAQGLFVLRQNQLRTRPQEA